jgi:flagellar protein FlgJ
MEGALGLPAPGLKPLDVMMASAPAKPFADNKAAAKAAAENFEAVFLNTMFQQMFTGIDGEGPFGGGSGNAVWRSLLTDQYARSFAKAGGVGIASEVYRTLIGQQEAGS